MKFGEPRTIHLKLVTPIFIWSGEDINPLSYIVEGDFVHVLDPDRFFRALTDCERGRYLEWIEPILDRLSELDDRIAQAGRNRELVRELRRQRRGIEARLSVERFIRERLRADPASFVRSRDCIAYSVEYATRPGDRGFKLHIKDAKHNPYIPGTELKGALRTAVLYAMLSDAENLDYAWFKERLSEFRVFLAAELSHLDRITDRREKRKRERRVRRAVEGELKELSTGLRKKLLRGTKDDAKFDFFKLVHLSDASPMPQGALRIEATESAGTKRPTRTFVEALVSGSECEFEVAMAEEIPWALSKLGLEGLSEWLSVEKLLEASYMRSRDILDEEARYFADEPRLQAQIARLQGENRPEAPLLRLGAGQGFLSTTVDLHVKRRDERLYDEAIREGVSFQRRWRTQRGNFPKTRRVVTDGQGNPLALLGWVKLIRV